MQIRLHVRGFRGRTLQFQERLEISEAEIDGVVPALAKKHIAAIAEGGITMIELEFLDEPDVNQRFFRIGTDPAGMVLPIAIASGDK